LVGPPPSKTVKRSEKRLGFGRISEIEKEIVGEVAYGVECDEVE